MAKVKVNELEGPALDWAVAKCEGRTIRRDPMGFHDGSYWIWEETPSGKGGILIDRSIYMRVGYKYSPSTNWPQGGPIIEQERIKLAPNLNGTWHGQIRHEKDHPLVTHKVLAGWTNKHGPTPLIAAMRCYVASKLGDEVDIPSDLLGETNVTKHK